jgi:ferritin-like metal-binding protein YciE
MPAVPFPWQPAPVGLAQWEALMKTSDDLFLHFLQDVYYAERQILKALPKMAKAAQSAALRTGFEEHLRQTEGQVERLQKVFDLIGQPAKGKTCEAIQGLIEEGEEVIEEFHAGAVRDSGLAACAQAVEHYEIARYGALIAWAKAGGHGDAAKLLQETLHEEVETDRKLTQLAHSELNRESVQQAA